MLVTPCLISANAARSENLRGVCRRHFSRLALSHSTQTSAGTNVIPPGDDHAYALRIPRPRPRGAGPTGDTRAHDHRRRRSLLPPLAARAQHHRSSSAPDRARWADVRLRCRCGHLAVPERVHRELLRVRHRRCVLCPVPAHVALLTAALDAFYSSPRVRVFHNA